MKILIACEYSGKVRDSFRQRGHEAVSCDLLPTDVPGPHYQGDVFDIIHGAYLSPSGDVFEHGLGKYGVPSKSKFIEWDMMIGFPPCTDLALSGSRWFPEKIKDGRHQKSIDFFMSLINAPIDRIAIENPIGIMSSKYRKPDQIINPYDFDDPARKPTCLWLKNLPKLKATNLGDAPLFGQSLNKGEFYITSGGKKIPKWYNLPPGENRWKIRSQTFPGIANAMAHQWGSIKKSEKFIQGICIAS